MSGGWGGRKVAGLVDQLIAVYGDRCHLCGNPVVRGLRRRHPLGPSVDHLIPRSKGGTDDLWNLRLAHTGCNSRRGAGRAPLSPARAAAEAGPGRGGFLDPPAETPPPVSIPPRNP